MIHTAHRRKETGEERRGGKGRGGQGRAGAQSGSTQYIVDSGHFTSLAEDNPDK